MEDLHNIPPPFHLVQLSTIPQRLWKGLPVFHPMEQLGAVAIWISDEPEDVGCAAYDVGVVLDWTIDVTDEGRIDVRFLTGMGASLRYTPDNLWVPTDALGVPW